jgi:hypothetical protein
MIKLIVQAKLPSVQITNKIIDINNLFFNPILVIVFIAAIDFISPI